MCSVVKIARFSIFKTFTFSPTVVSLAVCSVSYISLHGSSITSGGKKQLLVVGAEQVDNLEKSALAAAGMLPKAKAPPAVCITTEHLRHLLARIEITGYDL